MPELRIDGLCALRGGKHVLGPLSMTVEPGQIVALIGTNGSGKSTLAETVAGLHPPTSGTVTLGSTVISGLRAERIVRHGLTLVPEGRQLFLDQTVEDNLVLGCYLRVRDRAYLRARLEEAYSRFPVLARKRRDVARKLSGGEQQMLALSRGLMTQPKVVILDEPSTGLAPLVVREFLDGLTSLKETGIAILLIEQLVHVALGVADRGFVLSRGQVAAEGPASDLLASDQLVQAYVGTTADRHNRS